MVHPLILKYVESSLWMSEKGLAPINILSVSGNLGFFEDLGVQGDNTVSQGTKNSTELDAYLHGIQLL